MSHTYHRKTFLKQLLLANTAWILQPLKGFAGGLTASGLVWPAADVQFFKSGDAQYDILRRGFNKRIDKHPQIIALANSSNGVAEAITYAIKNNLPVAVKSGGHCMEGFSCNDGGMVINLSQMKTVQWISNEVISVQPGCTLADLYAALLAKNRIIPGGSCGSVGIGGLTLGGGYGLLSRRYGLTCDNLLEVTMVDGKGSIVNSKNDPELLWACKGGGNGNFGVITAMKFKTYPAPPTMQSFRFRAFKTDAKRMRRITEKWFAITRNLPPACFSALVLNGKTAYILLTNTEKNTPEIEQVIKLLSLLADKTTRSGPQPLARALKVFYAEDEPLFFKNASAGLYKSFDDIKDPLDNVLNITRNTPGMIYQVNTLGGNIQNAALEKASSFPHRGYNYFSELQCYWQQQGQETRMLKQFEAVQDIFNAAGINTQYRNYPDINFKNWPVLYYGDNYARLQKIKALYDPANVIRHEQSVKAMS